MDTQQVAGANTCPPAIQGTLDRARSLVAQAETLTNHANSIVSRVCGPLPPATNESAAPTRPPRGPGLCDTFIGIHDDMEDELRRLGSHLERLATQI